MTITGWIPIVVLVAALTGLAPLLGGYMARVYDGERVSLSRILAPVERIVYRGFGIAAQEQQDWKAYARSLLLFSAAGWLMLYLILRTQGSEPLNPQSFHSGPWDLSFNTASSFVSNTSWQYYGGETTLSYLPGLGTLRTDTPTFVIFLIGFVAVFAVLTFLSLLVLAPLAQGLSSQLLG